MVASSFLITFKPIYITSDDQSVSVVISHHLAPYDAIELEMDTPAVLSSRMGDTIAAILPKITTTVSKRASPKIDLATAENWLIRSELCRLYKEAIQKGLNNEVCSRTPKDWHL